MSDKVVANNKSTDQWTTRSLLEWMTGYFEGKSIDSVRFTAEMLLSHILKCERLRLYMEVDRPASKSELAELRAMVKRVGEHEPVQYVLGEGWFYGRPFHVEPSTLIPRPSTESLVETVINHVRAIEEERIIRIADIGTGTGCVIVTLIAELPNAASVATDINESILSLARRNAERHKVSDRIKFTAGSLFESVEGTFDVIVSNPPYIPDHEWPAVERNVKDYEPESALRGGKDGLDVIRPLITTASDYLVEGGLLAIEVADSHADSVKALMEAESNFKEVSIVKDNEGFKRVARAHRI